MTFQITNFVNGRWREGTGKMLEKRAPRDGKVLCCFGAGAPGEVNEAVAIARRAFEDGRWSRLPVTRRKDVLYNFARLIEERREELALLECIDVGKPISDALGIDIPMTATSIKRSAEAADRVSGQVYGVDESSLTYQLRRPRGVVAGIVGWNFPLVLAANKIGPALATGNCLVLKPSELTSLATARLGELASEAGVPDGVLNIVHGDSSVGAILALHPDVDMVTFTGSSDTGKKMLVAAGQSNMKRLVLECGGKAPNIVFEDSPDLNAVAEAVVARAFWNQGQVCTASSRLLVQESIKDQLLGAMLKKVVALTPGDPLRADTKFGALVSKAHQRKVTDYIHSGERDGARMIFHSRSSPPFNDGYYISPVLFDQVSPLFKIAQEEIFGPVLSILTFRDEAEAIRISNNTIYGLSAIVWTQDMGRAHRVTHGINAGWIVVSASKNPVHGTGESLMAVGGHKQSGIGVEGGIAGLEEYTTTTTVQYCV